MYKNDGNAIGVHTWIWLHQLTEDGTATVGQPAPLIRNTLVRAVIDSPRRLLSRTELKGCWVPRPACCGRRPACDGQAHLTMSLEPLRCIATAQPSQARAQKKKRLYLQPWEGDVVEAPFMWENNGTFYLFYSANSYANGACTCYPRCREQNRPLLSVKIVESTQHRRNSDSSGRHANTPKLGHSATPTCSATLHGAKASSASA